MRIWNNIEIYAIVWGSLIGLAAADKLADGASRLWFVGIVVAVMVLVSALISSAIKQYSNVGGPAKSSYRWGHDRLLESQDGFVERLFEPQPFSVGAFWHQKILSRACEVVGFIAFVYIILCVLLSIVLPEPVSHFIAYINMRCMPYALLSTVGLLPPEINALVAGYHFVLSLYINGLAIYVVAIVMRLFSLQGSRRPLAAASIGKDRKLYLLLHAVATVALPAAYLLGALSIEYVFLDRLALQLLLCAGWVSLALWSVSAYVSGTAILFFLRGRSNGAAVSP